MRSQPLDGSQSRIFKVAGEAGTIELRNATMPLPGDVQRRTFPLLTLEEWRVSLRERVIEIGQQDPSKASLISRKLLFYRGTAGEREELEGLGIQVPDSLHQEGLPGGMLAEAAGLVVPLLKGVVKIVVEGNEEDMRKQMADKFVKAKIQLPNGEWIEGLHAGERKLSDPERSFRTYGMKRFTLLAFGHGRFISEKVKYEGDFHKNLFHDLEGQAKYFIDQDTRYIGGFLYGKRARHGVLEKYNRETGQFYLYYRGTWKEDQPETGTYYSPQGKVIAHIKDGIMQGLRRANESRSLPNRTSQNLPGFVLEPSEEKDADERAAPFSFPSKPKAPLLRTLSPAFDPGIPPEIACPLIAKKLNNPQMESLERIERERIAEEKLEQAQGQIKELLSLLEEQKQDTLEQMRIQEERQEEMRREMVKGMQAIQSSYEETQQALRREMEERITRKEEELRIAEGLSQKQAQIEVEKERRRLQVEYQQQLEKAKQENAALIQEQKVQQERREKEMALQHQKFNEKLRSIAAQKTQRAQELQAGSVPKMAFGKADWEKYFGEVGEEPPLPADIKKILQGPCPFWKGKRVQDTHMLTLIPKTVKGGPLTLNTLEEMIQHPRGGGHATKYRYYYKRVKKKFGDQQVGRSYWVLMTKGVLEGSRIKGYYEQRALVEEHAIRTVLPYEMPHALEAAVSILMHHVKTGERLYSDKPLTYTYCQEVDQGRGLSLAVGAFSAEGLRVTSNSTAFFEGIDGSIGVICAIEKENVGVVGKKRMKAFIA